MQRVVVDTEEELAELRGGPHVHLGLVRFGGRAAVAGLRMSTSRRTPSLSAFRSDECAL